MISKVFLWNIPKKPLHYFGKWHYLKGRNFRGKKFSRNLISRFWPHFAKLNSAKLANHCPIAKLNSAKFNFFRGVFYILPGFEPIKKQKIHEKLFFLHKVPYQKILVKNFETRLKCLMISYVTYSLVFLLVLFWKKRK